MHGKRRSLNRRNFIAGVAALPVVWPSAGSADSAPPSRAFLRDPPPVTAADQVLNVADFDALARVALPPAHYGFLASGADDDQTVLRNHEAFAHFEIRAHRFSDLRHMDTTRQVFGSAWPRPIYLSAISGTRAFHPEGELAVARAAATRSTQLMLSTGASNAIEPVQQARGSPVWQQLYATDDWALTEGLVRRAETAVCTAIVLTADARGARNNETMKRAMQSDSRHCVDCHPGNSHDMWRRAPMFAGLDVSRVTSVAPPDLSVHFLDRLRALVKSRLIVKGIVVQRRRRCLARIRPSHRRRGMWR